MSVRNMNALRDFQRRIHGPLVGRMRQELVEAHDLIVDLEPHIPTPGEGGKAATELHQLQHRTKQFLEKQL